MCIRDSGEKARPAEDYDNSSGSLILTELAVLYYKSGRYADVVTLLEQAPYWGAKDISELLTESEPAGNPVELMSLHAPSASLPLAYIAANSLIQVDVYKRQDRAGADDEDAVDIGAFGHN